jgi:hypothetical protein
MQALESNLDCAGLCKLPYFWYFRSVTEGQPPQTCSIALKNFYDDTVGVLAFGIVCSAIIGAVLLSCTFGLVNNKHAPPTASDSDSITSNDD